MDIQTHKKEFDKIVTKYNLFEKEKAEEIAKFLTNSQNNKIHFKDFAKIFSLEDNEAKLFLSFIEKGLIYKESIIDNSIKK